MLARNVRVGRGEIDLLISDRGTLCAVEVKAGRDAIEHFTEAKRGNVATAAAALRPRPDRLDLVTVIPRRSDVLVRWMRDV